MTHELLDFAISTALEAGEIIRSSYGKVETWQTKEGKGDIVTEVDTRSEALILQRIQSAYPDHNIVTEESGKITASEEDTHTWYIDPLDGTRNYAVGIPFFATTIAVVKGGEALAGVTYDPLRDELFKASRGGGAFVDDHRMQLVPDPDMEDILVSVSWSRRRPGSEKFPTYVDRLHTHTSYLRRLGAASLAIAYVAAGRFDAYIQGMITPWDIVNGVLLVTEAGGKVTDFEGSPIDFSRSHSDILAANAALHGTLLESVVKQT